MGAHWFCRGNLVLWLGHRTSHSDNDFQPQGSHPSIHPYNPYLPTNHIKLNRDSTALCHFFLFLFLFQSDPKACLLPSTVADAIEEMQVHWCFPLKTWSWSLLIWNPRSCPLYSFWQVAGTSDKITRVYWSFTIQNLSWKGHEIYILRFRKNWKGKGKDKRISKCPSPNIMGISNDTSFKHICIPNMFQLHEKTYWSMAYWSNVNWGPWILRICKSNFQSSAHSVHGFCGRDLLFDKKKKKRCDLIVNPVKIKSDLLTVI